MEGSTAFACRFAGIAAGVAALAVAGCGGGERQDADEPSGTFRVDVVNASFPTKQHLAKSERFVIAVRNTGREAVPNVAVTVDSFAARSQQAGLADPSRPVWIVDAAPRGGDTAYTNTWALGRLAPGQTRRFVWRVTAVQAGTHTVKWRGRRRAQRQGQGDARRQPRAGGLGHGRRVGQAGAGARRPGDRQGRARGRLAAPPVACRRRWRRCATLNCIIEGRECARARALCGRPRRELSWIGLGFREQSWTVRDPPAPERRRPDHR